jgi:glycosyltransferase involved in cell wall biosynthesis
MRMLVLVMAAHKPADDELRRLIAEDVMPDAILAEDSLGARSLDDRDLMRIPGRRGRLLRRLPIPLALSLDAWWRRDEFDVVLSWGERLAFPLALLLTLTRRPRVGHIAILMFPFDTSSPSRLKRAARRVVFPVLARRGMDRLCVPAPRQRDLVVERWRIPEEHMVAANWPVDTRFWRPVEQAGDLICSVGREMRDYATLIEALRTLDIPCHIAAGTGILNQAFSSIDPRASNLRDESLPPGVTTGPKSPAELRELYGRSRLVVVPLMPSESDNGVTTIIEAMAMGRAVVSTDTVGRARILEHGVNCLLVPPRDPVALRAAIEELWSDPARCAQLGAVGRERVAAEYNIDRWVTAILAAAADVASSAAR